MPFESEERKNIFGTIKSHLCVYYMSRNFVSFSGKIMLKVLGSSSDESTR